MKEKQCELREFHSNLYKKDKGIWIYGATVGGNIVMQRLRKLGIEPKGFIDRDNPSTSFCNLPLIKPTQNGFNDCIVIITLTRSFESACKTLYDIGCTMGYTCGELLADSKISDFDLDNNDKILAEDFLRKYSYYAKIYSSEAMFHTLEVFITERCNLNCKDCFHLIPYYEKKEDHEMEEIIAGLKKLLPALGRVYDLNVLGGEPMLHNELPKLVGYLKQSGYVDHVTIITNGCVLPNEDLLSIIRNDDFCRFRISNYGKLSRNLSQIMDVCKKNGIQSYISNEPWSDTREIKNYHHSMETLKDILPRCPFGFTYLYIKGRVFRCDRVAHLNRLGYEDTAEHDSVNIISDSQTVERIRKDILALMKREYLCACEHCGVISEGMVPVERGIQLMRR